MSIKLSRRAFLGSSALLGATVALNPRLAFAAPTKRLKIEKRVIEVYGKAADVFGIAGPDGRQGAYLAAGEDFAFSLDNQSGEDSIIHWHGQTPSPELDGVAATGYVDPLANGEVRDFLFAPRPGTHWMHSHHGLQEQRQMAAPLIVRTKADEASDLQDVTVLLHDFSFRSPEEILTSLTRASAGTSGGMNMSGMAMPGMKMNAPAANGMSNMAMNTDLNDIEYDAYLANDRTLADPEVIRTERNGRVRLRLINGAASTAFWIDLGSASATVLAVDGNEVEPITGSRFPLAQAQRLDLLIEVAAGQALPILAQREGSVERTGIILAAPDAPIAKLPDRAEMAASPVDLSLEARLRAKAGLTDRAGTKTPVMLMGAMDPYSWSIDGNTWPNPKPIGAKHGERVELELINHSMMAHPMHLHGHHFQITAINGMAMAGALRDTILVPAMATVTVAFDADNPGRWLFHCHNLYHMATGMMTEVSYL
tara:strand:+ start:22574 stop:24019 length:1446 start_codon:yes stop_codon:yes gene_type:complete